MKRSRNLNPLGSARNFAAWLLLVLFAVSALAAGYRTLRVSTESQTSTTLTVSPATVALTQGSYTAAQVSNASGTIRAQSQNTAVATVSLVGITRSGATLNVYGVGPGTTTVIVRDNKRSVSVGVTVTPKILMTVSPTSLSVLTGVNAIVTASNATGTLSASSANTGVATVSTSGSTVTVTGVAAGMTTVTVSDNWTSATVPVTVTAPPPPTGGGTSSGGAYALLAWNDLGMHCMDGKDYSVFSILPPFNNLHAQLVNASTGKPVTSGVTLTYEAVADPTGSINTSSANKTNFWQWSSTVYGASLAANVGLTGNATPSLTPKPMSFDAANGWFAAEGLPITPYDDAGNKNYYPTVKVVARDGTGKLLATTTTVLPVSDEITCVACHASRPVTETNQAKLAAKPAGGWVNNGDVEKDWKLNILKLHDQKQAGNASYAAALSTKGLGAGLYASAIAGKPALCASCHASKALPGTGIAGISAMTSATHGKHAQVVDPANMQTLEASTNRNSCYNCHPGSETKCLRGAMGDAVDANGNALMSCQSCHASMSKVGDPSRTGWLDEPNCQACHYDGKRTTSAVDASGNLVKPTDARFATNPDVPAKGFSLYRFSKGHGNLQCESCHGATHAVYPSSHVNDNLQSIALQGYAGTVRECTVCHATVPLSANGGPHGLHTIGQAWVTGHHDMMPGDHDPTTCKSCHGSDYRGSPLAKVTKARTFNIGSGRTKVYAVGNQVGCYDCHNGPKP